VKRQFYYLIAAALFGSVGFLACSGADASSKGVDRSGGASPGTEAPSNFASIPQNSCGWLSVAEVEAIIGKLEGAPERDGTGCWYHLPIDSLTPEWKQMRANERRLRQLGGHLEGFKQIELIRPALYVDVDVTGNVTEEIATAAAENHLAQELPASTAETETSDPVADTKRRRWDYTGSPMGRRGFVGRSGHVKVTIAVEKLEITDETLETLAAQVLERVPDRPFAHEAANWSVNVPAGSDPCSVLTPAEAESLLGKLTVPPYRTRDESPLADPAGKSCAYFTRGHHALVITPEWSDGKTTLQISRGLGGLIASAADLPGVVADTLDQGPWDDVAADGPTGDLLFLKGDRLVRIGYAMSSLDAAGAIRVAQIAIRRLQN
jgi:hypothetical protein